MPPEDDLCTFTVLVLSRTASAQVIVDFRILFRAPQSGARYVRIPVIEHLYHFANERIITRNELSNADKKLHLLESTNANNAW